MAVSPTSIHWNTRHLPCFLCLFTVPKHMCTSLNLQIASFTNRVVNDSSMAKVNLCEQNIFASPPSESFDLVWNIGTPHGFPKSASLLAIKWCSIVWAWRDNYNYLISTTNCELTYRCLAVARPPIAAMLACVSLGARVVMEVCRTSSVWLKYESILRKLQRVSEVATNHWVFSKVWLVTWLYLILLLILG